ncbi:hypothetical protein [Nonomuraea sp. NPDC023979]|uniref:hypothetical protein n=1 Tax=Nonomuraea sp. NPDC023979 TaxID=3154796 RepID=UPI0033C5A76A
MTTQQIAWPEGVIARYLTVGGATVDVIDDTTEHGRYSKSVTHRLHGACTGERCGETYYGYSFSFWKTDDLDSNEDFQSRIAQIQAWAQRHAEKCRAMPRPEVAR